MAIIGQKLATPEPGWKRYDNTTPSLKYEGIWSIETHSGHYGGSKAYTTDLNAKIKFSFLGTKLRLIIDPYENKPSNIPIIIDGVQETFSEYLAGKVVSTQNLRYEKVGLAYGIHTVEIRTPSDLGEKNWNLDAIDIDDTGRLLHPQEKIDLKDITSLGDRIRCHYQASSGQFGICSGLGEEISDFIPSASSSVPNGDFYWIYSKNDHRGNKVFIADRVVQYGLSWDTLNTAGVATQRGVPIQKARFTGTNYINEGNAPELFITGDITYGATFRLNKFPSNYTTILNMTAWGESLDTNALYALWIKPNGSIQIGHEYGAGADQLYTTKGSYIKADEKVTVTVVRNTADKQYHIYINGEYKESITYNYEAQIASSGNKHSLGIGRDNGATSTGGYYFNGDIYHVYIWNKVCTSEEIQKSETNELLGKEDGLVRLMDYSLGREYKMNMRLLTGGVSNTDTDNEWDAIIVNSNIGGTPIPGENIVWNAANNVASWISTSPRGVGANRVGRGYASVSQWWGDAPSSTATSKYGFRPVLIVQRKSQTYFLIEDGVEIKTVQNNQLIHIGKSPVTKSMFLQGFQSLSDLTSDMLSQLSSTAMLKIWTDDPQKTFSTLKTTGDVAVPYRYKVEIRHPERTVTEWTDFTKEDVRNTAVISPGYFTDLTERTVTVKVEQVDSTLVTGTGTVSLYDTAPEIELTMVGLGFKASISDAEGDRVQYKVELNGKQIYPLYDGFSPLFISPVTFERSFMSREVNVNPLDFTTPNNTITLTARDEYGKESTATLEFAGTYAGILFADMDYTYYTSDLGDILRYLDVGVITAGQTTPSYPIRLINKHDFSLTNLEIFKGEGTLPKGAWVELSYDDSPFIPLSSLTYDEELEYNGEFVFHARIATDIESEPGDSTFDIYVKADPLR